MRRQRDVRSPGLRAAVPVLGDHVFGRDGRADHSVDAGQRDLPERVRDEFTPLRNLFRGGTVNFKFDPRPVYFLTNTAKTDIEVFLCVLHVCAV